MALRRFVFSCFVAFVAAAATIAIMGLRVPAPGPAAKTAERAITLEELARHAVMTDCWMAVEGGVYDVSGYAPSHPAPESALTRWCGKEATEAFLTKGVGRPHSRAARIMLERRRIGILSPP